MSKRDETPPITTYEQSVQNGEIVQSFRNAIVYASLWAIAASWANAVRGIAILIVPQEEFDIVIAEILAAVVTTAIGVTIAYLSCLDCCSFRLPCVGGGVEGGSRGGLPVLVPNEKRLQSLPAVRKYQP